MKTAKTAKAKRQSPKLVLKFPPEGGYTSTFHHSDGRKTAKTAAPQKKSVKPRIEDYDQGGNLGWYLRTVAKQSPNDELSDILMDVGDWPAILEAMIDNHGENAKLSDFDPE